MIEINKEFYNNNYYFLIRENNKDYVLDFSFGSTISEAKEKKESVDIKKDEVNKLKKFIEKTSKEKKIKNSKKLKREIDEFISSNLTFSNTKTGIINPAVSSRGGQTMDKIVATSRQATNPILRGYMPGFGIAETNMENSFGFEETKDKDGKETYNYYKKVLKMPSEDAKKRTEEQGKDPKRSEKTKNKNIIARMRLSEIQKNKVIKMVEDILVKQRTDEKDLGRKEPKMSPLVQKNLRSLKRQAEKEGLSMSDLLKMIKGE